MITKLLLSQFLLPCLVVFSVVSESVYGISQNGISQVDPYYGGSVFFFVATTILACESLSRPQSNSIWQRVLLVAIVAAIPAGVCWLVGKDQTHLAIAVPYATTVAICSIASVNVDQSSKRWRVVSKLQLVFIVVCCLLAVNFYAIRWGEYRDYGDNSWTINPGLMPTLSALTVWQVARSMRAALQLKTKPSMISRLLRNLLFATGISIATAIFVLTVAAAFRVWLAPGVFDWKMFDWNYRGEDAIKLVTWALDNGAPQFGYRGYVLFAVAYTALISIFEVLYNSHSIAATGWAIFVPSTIVLVYCLRCTAGHIQLPAMKAYKPRVGMAIGLISSTTFLVMLGACFVGFQNAWEKAEIVNVALTSSPTAIGIWEEANDISFRNDNAYAFFLRLAKEHGFRREGAFSISDGDFQIELYSHARSPVLLAYRRAALKNATLPFRKTHWIEVIPIENPEDSIVFVREYEALRAYEPIKESLQFFHDLYGDLADRVLKEFEVEAADSEPVDIEVDYQECYRRYWCELARMWLEPFRLTPSSDGMQFVPPTGTVFSLPMWTTEERAIRQRLKSVFDERIRLWFEDTSPDSTAGSFIILNEMVDVHERSLILDSHPPIANSPDDSRLRFLAWRSDLQEFDIKLEGIDRVELLSDPLPTVLLFKAQK